MDMYELLHNGSIYYIPFAVDSHKAHKILDRIERRERRWDWMFKNDGKLALIVAAIVFTMVVWLGA